MTSAVLSYEEIVQHANSVSDDTAKNLPSKFVEGAFVRQGDIYLYFFREKPMLQLVRMEVCNAQLAQGDSQGSRHVLDRLDSVTMFRLGSPDALQGPVFLVTAPVTVTHPEHGDVCITEDSLKAGPIWVVVTYQRDYSAELLATRD